MPALHLGLGLGLGLQLGLRHADNDNDALRLRLTGLGGPDRRRGVHIRGGLGGADRGAPGDGDGRIGRGRPGHKTPLRFKVRQNLRPVVGQKFFLTLGRAEAQRLQAQGIKAMVAVTLGLGTMIGWKRIVVTVGEKIGNDVRCTLPPEALAIIKAMPRTDARIFPFNGDAITAAFTRACKMTGIENLHFHDLRHEGISRLFEMGWNIPQVATVSGHRSWQSLKRYTHIRPEDLHRRWEALNPTPQQPVAT